MFASIAECMTTASSIVQRTRKRRFALSSKSTGWDSEAPGWVLWSVWASGLAISTTYDIISPSDGHMRRHQHKRPFKSFSNLLESCLSARGLGVGEDCRYAAGCQELGEQVLAEVFSDAAMNVDTYHLPTPSERPERRSSSASTALNFVQFLSFNFIQLSSQERARRHWIPHQYLGSPSHNLMV